MTGISSATPSPVFFFNIHNSYRNQNARWTGFSRLFTSGSQVRDGSECAATASKSSLVSNWLFTRPLARVNVHGGAGVLNPLPCVTGYMVAVATCRHASSASPAK